MAVLLWLCSLCVAPPPALATDLGSFAFPEPPALRPVVDFWVRVFTEVSENQLLLHDRVHVQVVYGVLDFTPQAQVMERRELRRYMNMREREEKQRIADLLNYIAHAGPESKLSPAARQLQARFADIDEPDVLRRAAQRIRGQRGLREKFHDAIIISGAYLPYMEAVFASRGLPVELSRLPLVESSFNIDAYSKSGAAGIWQFIPSSARQYMTLNELRDDRRDPWISTHAAAAHLDDDYSLLGQWPLAVTAYNFGRYGVARGLQETGGDSLVDLIRDYEHPRWGFAGKNFYAEFLAAVEVERNAVKYFGPTRRAAPLRFDEVDIRHYVAFETLAGLAGMSPGELAELNPAFSSAVVNGQLYLPPGSRLRVPEGRGFSFTLAYSELPSSAVFERQREYFVHHRVRHGETLSGIARHYRTSVRAISQLNALNSRHFIRVGQELKIATGEVGYAGASQHRVAPGESLARIARRYKVKLGDLVALNGIERPELLAVGTVLKLPAPPPPAYVKHRIKSGQTIEGLARRYGVSVHDIARANDLQDVHRIRAGQLLRIPSGS